MGSLKLTLAAAMFSLLVAPAANAADLGPSPLDPGPGSPAPLVELGTGWYLRGDAAFSRDSIPQISSDLTAPNVIRRNGWDVGLGGGYKFNNWFRTDATYDYLNGITKNGRGGSIQCPDKYSVPVAPALPVLINQTCGVNQATRIHRWAALANGYLDLGTWSGLSPYVGAGIGFSHLDTSGSVTYTNPNGTSYTRTLTDGSTPPVTTTYFYDKTLRNKTYQLAWALMAGVSVDVAEHTSLDFGYRYLNLGTAKSVSSAAGSYVSKSITEQQFRVGIRYMID